MKVRSHLQLVATDMDGTLTHQGEFTHPLVQALEDLREAGITVLVVTGRSAGWVSGLLHYLPIAGAIAENGGVYFSKASPNPQWLVDLGTLADHRRDLAGQFQKLQDEFPQIQESEDNRFRLTDWTFDVQGLSQAQLQKLAQICEDEGFGFTYSNVQCHIKPQQQDKAQGLTQVLTSHFSSLSRSAVVTVGDSINDESLFDAQTFPCSVGVANVQTYWDRLRYRPAYVTHGQEVQGFLELSNALLTARNRRLPQD